MGFFTTCNVPSRRVVQYRRSAGAGANTIYIPDESVLGEPVDELEHGEDLTGLGIKSGGMVYEVSYLPDAGPVYFETQPADAVLASGKAKLKVVARAGMPPYKYQWFKDGATVVNVPAVDAELAVNVAGEYFVQVTDAYGGSAVSKAVKVSKPEKAE